MRHSSLRLAISLSMLLAVSGCCTVAVSIPQQLDLSHTPAATEPAATEPVANDQVLGQFRRQTPQRLPTPGETVSRAPASPVQTARSPQQIQGGVDAESATIVTRLPQPNEPATDQHLSGDARFESLWLSNAATGLRH